MTTTNIEGGAVTKKIRIDGSNVENLANKMSDNFLLLGGVIGASCLLVIVVALLVALFVSKKRTRTSETAKYAEDKVVIVDKPETDLSPPVDTNDFQDSSEVKEVLYALPSQKGGGNIRVKTSLERPVQSPPLSPASSDSRGTEKPTRALGYDATQLQASTGTSKEESVLYALPMKESAKTSPDKPVGVATKISPPEAVDVSFENRDMKGDKNQNVEGLTYADVEFSEKGNATVYSNVIISTEEVTMYAEIRNKNV